MSNYLGMKTSLYETGKTARQLAREAVAKRKDSQTFRSLTPNQLIQDMRVEKEDSFAVHRDAVAVSFEKNLDYDVARMSGSAYLFEDEKLRLRQTNRWTPAKECDAASDALMILNIAWLSLPVGSPVRDRVWDNVRGYVIERQSIALEFMKMEVN